ncbi:glycoside hydrolase family 6 protein [Streptomyces aureus]
MRRRTPIWLAALSAGLAALLAVPPAHAAGAAPAAGTAGRGPSLYVPDANPAAYRQALDLVRAGRARDAAGIVAMVNTPQAVWFGDQTPAEVEKEARAVVRDAGRKGAVPALALYDIPGRDCSNYSAGGAADTAQYKEWIDAVARGIGRGDAIVVLEPDALALLPSDCGQDDAQGTKTAARYTEVNYAVDSLEPLRGTRVYLDTGHPGWHSVNSIVPRLIEGGVARASGFYTNASNYNTDDANSWYGKLISSCLAYADGGGDVAQCPNQWWARADAQTWIDTHVTTPPSRMKHFVTDSSRNGRGTWTPPSGKYTDAQDWCNPPGRGLGARPTLRTGDPLQDARLWIKTPGESDGLCLRGTAGPEDPERGTVDPKAGDWFPQQALELSQLAEPPLLPGK